MSEAYADGRVMRREASRQRIIDAVVQLATEQGVDPTAEKVAELAGVTTRTVFRHFDDVESLRREIVADFQAQSAALSVPFDPARDWREQLDELIVRRTGIFERYTNHIRWSQALRHQSPTIEADVKKYYRRLRNSIKQRLPKELAADTNAVAALEVVLSWETWLRLRRDQRLSINQASAVVKSLVEAILSQHGLT